MRSKRDPHLLNSTNNMRTCTYANNIDIQHIVTYQLYISHSKCNNSNIYSTIIQLPFNKFITNIFIHIFIHIQWIGFHFKSHLICLHWILSTFILNSISLHLLIKSNSHSILFKFIYFQFEFQFHSFQFH